MYNFSHYVAKQDSLQEMAKIRPDLVVNFDEQDYDYLKHFNPQIPNIIMQAIMYRYNYEKVLRFPYKEFHDIEITTQIDEDGKTVQRTFKFDKVPTHTKHLIEKLSDNYDITKVKVGRVAARKAAEQFMSGVIPTLHMNNALTDAAKEGRRDQGPYAAERDTGWRNLPRPRQAIKLDGFDRRFLDWFDRPENAAEFGQFKITAFCRRYSDYFYELKNPNTHIDMEFKDRNSKMHIAKNVPVYPQQLQQRIKALKNHGVDFLRKRLSRNSAANWIANGVLNLHLGQGSGSRWEPMIV